MKKIVYEKFIEGIPKPKRRSRGNVGLVKTWGDRVVNGTKDGIGIVTGECVLNIVFYFHASQYPADLPFGPDLDNYIKALQDYLNETIFIHVPGKDSCIVSLNAKKIKTKEEEKTGVCIKIYNS